MEPADHTKDSVKMEEFEIVRVKIENVNSDFSEEVGRPLDDGIVRIVKIEPTSLECMEIKEERSEEHITIPSTKDDAGLSDQESDSIQTSDILSCQEQVKSHSSELPYKCSVCGKGFYQSSHFHIHVRTHNSKYPYSCSICGKAFRGPSHYRIHMRVHNEEEPYNCSVCGKTFRNIAHCRTHMRDHNDKRLYKCTICDKAFFLSSSFRDHMRVHSGERPYECPTCRKTFVRSSNYYTHLKIHQVERPHKCTVCGKGFKQASGLQQHMRTHNKECQYKCTVCVKEFRKLSCYRTHVRSHSRFNNIQVVLTKDTLKAKQSGSFPLVTTVLNNLPYETIIGKLCHVLPRLEAKTSPEAGQSIGQSKLRQTSATSGQEQDKPATQ
uniref:zinc finger protein 391-like isoform X2 n=1 Tax=Myxine glutinosa TaxID=7769 RepID=UPI00358EA9CA